MSVLSRPPHANLRKRDSYAVNYYIISILRDDEAGNFTMQALPYSVTSEQFFINNNIRMIASSDPLGWEGLTLREVWANSMRDFQRNPLLKNDALIVKLKGATHQQLRLNGNVFNNHIVPGTLLLFPCQFQSEIRFETAHTYAVLEFDRDMFIELASGLGRSDPSKIELQPALCFSDPLLYHFGRELCHEVEQGAPQGSLFASSVISAMMFYLMRKYSNFSRLPGINGGRLTTEQFRKINEYIHEHLDQKITLTDLSRCLYVSVPHFERMFRATLHCAPYQYVLECRLEQAKCLLKGSRLTIYDVARQCGFANQSHFTRHFTRHTGVPPARYMSGASIRQ